MKEIKTSEFFLSYPMSQKSGNINNLEDCNIHSAV